MSKGLPTIPEILTNYVTAMGKLIGFLAKKLPENINICKVKTLFIFAKNNEVVLFNDTRQIILDYHKQIASGDRQEILDIDFSTKVDMLATQHGEEDKAQMIKTVISEIQQMVSKLNGTEWNQVSRWLKDLLAAASQHKIFTSNQNQK